MDISTGIKILGHCLKNLTTENLQCEQGYQTTGLLKQEISQKMLFGISFKKIKFYFILFAVDGAAG